MSKFLENNTNLKSLISFDNRAFHGNMTYVIFKNEANHILNRKIKTNLSKNLN